MNKLPLPRVDIATIKQPEIRALSDAFVRYRYRLEVVDMTTDIRIPSMLALVIDEHSDRGPGVSIGAKTDVDPLWAIRGAIEEAWHMLSAGRVYAELQRETVFRKWQYDQILMPDDRIRFWARSATHKYLDFFFQSPKTKYRGPHEFQSRDVPTFLQRLIRALGTAGINDVFYRDLTIPSLAKKGFRVVFTFAPEFTHMFINENDRATGGPRLKSAPQRMGYEVPKHFNTFPHPFA